MMKLHFFGMESDESLINTSRACCMHIRGSKPPALTHVTASAEEVAGDHQYFRVTKRRPGEINYYSRRTDFMAV